MYRKEAASFVSSDGSTDVRYWCYLPEDEPKAIVQIAHGMAEHFGRYHIFSEFLVNRGFLVCGNDHLGHGETALSPDDYGYFGEKNGWIHMVDDLHLLTAKMKIDHGNLPYYLIGHSMGSLLSRAYLSCYGKDVSGAVIIGTSGNNPKAKAALPLIELISKVRGNRYRSRMVHSLAFGGYNKRYGKNSHNKAWLSKDEEVGRSVKSDPKCNFIFTVGGFRDLMKLLVYVSRDDWALEVPAHLPIMILSGDMDPVGDYGEGTRQVFKRLQMSGQEDVALKLYSDLRHELLNEPERESVYEDIYNWLQSHMG